MQEDVALDEALQAEILELEGKLQTADHFALLGVPNDAEPAEVKAAFYKLCLRMHPDRYFRKKLGSFKARLEKIFKALSHAHQTLTDPARREAYLVAHPSLRKPPPAPKRAPMKRMSWKKEDLQLPIPDGKTGK